MSARDELLDIGLAFDYYNDERKANPEIYEPVIDHIKESNQKQNKIITIPNINTETPNTEEWDKILSYYYYIHDNNTLSVSELAELEIWLIKFIEPRPIRTQNMTFKMDSWKERELAKYEFLVSDYCPGKLKKQIHEYNMESTPFEKDWLDTRIRKIETIYRQTAKVIVRRNNHESGVVRSSASEKGVVNLKKILGK